MMTIRCRSRLFTLLFCLPLGLCAAGTAFGASDDDEEDWHDTKGPGGKKLDDDDERSRKAKKSDADKDSDDEKKSDADKDSDDEKKSDADKDSDDEKKADDDAKVSTKGKKKAQWKSKDLPSSTKVSFAALGSYGFPNPLVGGLGLRGGVHFEGLIPLYIGGVGQYFFGTQSSKTSFKGVVGQEDKATRTVALMYFGAEVGAEVEASADLQLRPYFGLGLGFNKDKVCHSLTGRCEGGSEIYPTITPGIAGLYYLGSFFLGADLRYLIVPGASTASGAVASATAGVRF